jgi:hypothetical protein
MIVEVNFYPLSILMSSLQDFSQLLHYLHREREKVKKSTAKPVRTLLTKSDREKILAKTDKKCHICGGEITGKWDADHVLSHSK